MKLGASWSDHSVDFRSAIRISISQTPGWRAGGNCLVILAESCRVSSLISARHIVTAIVIIEVTSEMETFRKFVLLSRTFYRQSSRTTNSSSFFFFLENNNVKLKITEEAVNRCKCRRIVES